MAMLKACIKKANFLEILSFIVISFTFEGSALNISWINTDDGVYYYYARC